MGTMRRPTLRSMLGLATIGGVLLAVAGYAVAGRGEASGTAREPTVFWPAPAFTLTDQQGQPVSSERLRGTVVIANFIYTHCDDICPLLTVQMQGLQDRLRREGVLGEEVQLLSFTVDPARDTPAVLAAYAERHGADPEAWRFLTGPTDTVVPLIVEGFRLGVDALPPPETPAQPHADGEHTTQDYAVMHSGRFVLIDRMGQVRAFYDGRDFVPERVIHDIRQLLR